MADPSSKTRPFDANIQVPIAMVGGSLIDQEDFLSLGTQLRCFDEQRETVIKRSRDIQKAAKHAIFSLHRNAFGEADARIASAMKAVEELEPLVRASPALRGGALSGALEELAEAVVFRGYLVEKRLLPSSALPMAEVEEYLGGVLDFTGELNRYAILRATERDREAVQRAHDVVEAIFSAYIQFELRNGNLRKKYDALKYTLLKLENTLYELSLTEAGGMASRKAGGGGQGERPEGGDAHV